MSSKPYIEPTETPSDNGKSQLERELDNAYRRAVNVAKLHKAKDIELSRGACAMDAIQIKNAKDELSRLKKSLDTEVKTYEMLGGTWDYEKERAKIMIGV